MKTHLLGFRVRAFIPGEGWREDRFELMQAAIECAQRCAPHYAIAERITRDQSLNLPGDWIGDEEFETVWEAPT
jgi:hypothetical protein